MIKFKYRKERLRNNLKMGIFFVSIGIILILFSFVIKNTKSISFLSIGVGEILAGISMFIIYYFENKRQYLTLKNEILIKNTLFPKKIKLSEIKTIREFANNLKLITHNTEFIINTQIIEPNSLKALKAILENHNLKLK